MKIFFRLPAAGVLLGALFLLLTLGFLASPILAQSANSGKGKTAAGKNERTSGKKAASGSKNASSRRRADPAAMIESRAARAAAKAAREARAAEAAAAGSAGSAGSSAASAVPGTADAEALSAEGEEPDEISPELAAEIEKAKRKGTVPEFSESGESGYNVLAEDEFYNESIRTRRDDDAVPVTSLVLRRYADYLVEKYDYNKDGKLSEPEWSKMGGAPQSLDMKGDFILEAPEIVYYLARYARNRTIFNPIPPTPEDRRHLVISDGSVLLRPLSGPMKVETPEEAEKAEEEEGLADLTEEELDAMLDETEESVGTVDDPKLFGLLLEEMDESKQREFAAPLEQVKGMPLWFLSRDTNGDGQLSLREFAPGLSLEATAFFGKLDLDHDGLLTPDEVREYQKNGGVLPEPEE